MFKHLVLHIKAVVDELFQIAFDIKKVYQAGSFAPLLRHGMTIGQAAHALVLHKHALGIFVEHAGDFKQAHAALFVIQIVLQGFDQATN